MEPSLHQAKPLLAYRVRNGFRVHVRVPFRQHVPNIPVLREIQKLRREIDDRLSDPLYVPDFPVRRQAIAMLLG